MKRFLALLLMLVLITSLIVGCSKPADSPEETEETEEIGGETGEGEEVLG